MRNTAFVVIGLLLLVVQSNLYRLVALIHRFINWLANSASGGSLDVVAPYIRQVSDLVAVPNLLLPLLVFAGVHEYSLARGVLLALVLGYAMDIFHGSPVGLFTFISVITFVTSRVAGVRLAAQTTITQVALAFVFAMANGLIVFVLLAIFGKNAMGALTLTSVILPHAVSTAFAAPLIFRLAERIHKATMMVPRAGEGPVR